MREMKDSGNKWIGDIPADWSCGKTIYYLSMPMTDGPHTTPQLYDDGVPFVSAEAVSCGRGKIDFDHIRGYISEEFYEECCKKYIPQMDDIYMIKSGATTGRVSIVDTDVKFTIWSPLAVYRVNKSLVMPKFMFYAIQSPSYMKQVEDGWNYGTQQNIGMRTLEKLKVAVPPYAEQKRIVEYLDTKWNEIDALAADIQSQIDTLEQYKRSVITEAVTKGLDRNVEMKESGIEWIGEIPKEWRIFQIKFLCKPNSIKIGPFGSSLSNKTFADAKYNVYGQANLVSGDFSATKNTVTEETFNNLRSYEVIPDDICVSMMGTIGKCRIVPEGISQGIMDSHLIKLRVNETLILPEFFTYVYDKDLGGICYAQMQYEKSGSIMDGLNTSIVKKLYMPIPSIAEQRVLISYLDAKCSEIDDTISLKKQQVETLEKLKKSAIYEYVTGKKEVPA